jgi:predicted nucleotidyltransferase
LRAEKNILYSIKNSILELIPDAEVILFGSRARKDNHDESDWDILVLTNNKVTHSLKRQISDKLFYISLEFESCINTLTLNKSDWNEKFKYYPLHFEIEKDGKVI